MEKLLEKESDEVTAHEAADLIGVTLPTVLKYASKNKLVPHKKEKCGKILFKKEEVLDFKTKKKKSTFKRSNLGGLSKHYSPAEKEVIQVWRLHPQDTGSVDVEIGLLTQRIIRIEEELKLLQNDESDFLIMRIFLLKAVGERRKRLNFLKSTDVQRYFRSLEKIGLMNLR